MARGTSGRIVLEIDPSQKDSLYSALTKDGLTLKDWFLGHATQYLSGRGQRVSEQSETYRSKLKPAKTRSTKVKKQTK